ncbi:MAG: RES family NAD+ phosphorylase [Bifidobacterium sp.]|uniref:RES family NAD+ phosphorylase n=1 Tax=Bifidobacterium sp. TaxID=41200 RepID=UPI0039EA47C5
MTNKYCCSNCFRDPELTMSIIPMLVADEAGRHHLGDCDYCGAKNATTLHPAALSQWFEMLLDCYKPDKDGKSLAVLFKEDWRLFDDPVMDEAHVKELVSDILDDGEIVRHCFSPIDVLVNETPERWDDLRDEMMHRNRWFLDKPIDLDRLADLLSQLITPANTLKEITSSWHRARLLSNGTVFPLAEMGAPPANLTGNGRANPAGIRYLYLGSTATTAVAEVRPHTGEKACVATFHIDPDIRVVDLRQPRLSVSPFILENAEQIAALRGGLPLLERLGEELTKPVQPSSAAFEYIPSQYLCELIKKLGYQGVLYRSSVSTGVNLALFFPELAHPVKTDVINVDRVTIDITTIAP